MSDLFPPLNATAIRLCKTRPDPQRALKQYLFQCMCVTDAALANAHGTPENMFRLLKGNLSIYHSQWGWIAIPDDYKQLIQEISDLE